MRSRSMRNATAIALTLAFTTSQIFIGVSFAEPHSASAVETATTVPQQATGVLTTAGNNPITVNGASAASGATIVSGASIQTPGGVSSTVNLGSLGSLEIDPNANLSLSFDTNSITVMLTEGCITLRTATGTTGTINTVNGVAGKTNPATSDVLRVCQPAGGGAASTVGTGGAGGTAGGLSDGAIAAIVLGGAGVVIGVALASRGDNPSPSGL